MRGVDTGRGSIRPRGWYLGTALLLLVLASLVGGALAAADVTPPIANAGPDQVVNEDTLVTFDGSGSTDNVGIVNYTWLLSTGADPGMRVLSLTAGYDAALFDPVRPLLYVLRPGNVSVVNLTTGSIDRVFPIEHAPRYPMSLAVSPAGTFLAVGIPTGERGYYFFGPYQSWIASFDLVAQEKIGEFFIDADVVQTLVTDDGHAIVAGGSGQWASVGMMDVRNGSQPANRGTIWQGSSIALHPGERRLYSVDGDGIYPPGVHRFDFDVSVGITSESYWPYHGTYPGSPLWVSDRLILTGGGYLLTSKDDPAGDMGSAGSIPGPVSLAAFDPGLGLIAAASGSQVTYYDLTTFERLNTTSLQSSVQAMMFRGSGLLAVVGNEVRALQLPRAYRYGVSPSSVFEQPGVYAVSLTVWDAANNSDSDTVTITVLDVTAPVADAGPDQSVIEGTEVIFDASRSTDNVGITTYTWSFVDAGPRSLSGAYVVYRFRPVGTYPVTLTVQDGANNSDTDTVTITVNRDSFPPVVSAGPDREVYKGALVTFDGTGSTDNLGVASYTWTFTDGTPQVLYGPSPSYRFLNVGTFLVTLTVEDLASNRATDTLGITVRDIALVEYNRPAGLRVGLPSGWDIRVAAYLPGFGNADVMAVDPISGAAVVVVSRSQVVEDTDAFLLSAAGSAIANLRSSYGYDLRIRGPEMRATAGARAAVFEADLTSIGAFQVVAVFANPKFNQLIFVVGSTDRANAEAYRPVFDAVIASAALVIPPDPVQNLVVILTILVGVTVASILAGLLVLRYRSRTLPIAEGISLAPLVAPPAVAPETAREFHRFCAACGSRLDEGTIRFCGRCGVPVH